MMPDTAPKFEGWMGLDPNAARGQLVWREFQPKPWEETDVDIRVTHCGVCASDLCVLRSGWRPTPYPCCVGHEIVGLVVRVGSQVQQGQGQGLAVGDRVGVGPQSDSCRGRVGDGHCIECSTGNEKYCTRLWTGTYAGRYLDGSVSYGGYATFHRVPAHFAIRIPEGIPSAAAAPMLCAGATVYAPLKQYGCGPGRRVGIVGVGGLGHFGILFARALGADGVVAFSRRASKRDDARALGADVYVATAEEPDWAGHHAGTLDLIISTVSSNTLPLADYLKLLRPNGAFVQVGNPEDGPFSVAAGALIGSGLRLCGSKIGSPGEIREMLALAEAKGVRPWIEERPMKEANQVILDMDHGRARYRYVLVN
ncbi:GroES-like protein [Aspergillus violaceofuscus CBS 115571]|uniref:alcohol dehydrogenase (NADP(+)) n=1 Tax=Aspergillus violaceofuscus (strain CBS 115571) TaxID=1450538 RepID=A0A2V5GYE9_ASPV1|nr:GroES-like protein [Aspergillus violaceofuscus CBS 115571]